MPDFAILGPLRVVVDGQVRPVGPRKHRVLLASLLLRANRPVPIEDLIDRLWPSAPPDGARRTAQTYVMRLRRALGPAGALLRTLPESYAIELDPGQLDLDRFTGLTDAAAAALRAGEPAAARDALRRGLALWRGAPLADVPSPALARLDVPRLVELRCRALERRIELDLALGPAHDLVAELRALVAEHPLRERFWALAIRALRREGRPAEALAAYHEADRLLGAELGVVPGAELRGLHAELLRGAPPAAAGGAPAVLDALERVQGLLAEAMSTLNTTMGYGDPGSTAASR